MPAPSGLGPTHEDDRDHPIPGAFFQDQAMPEDVYCASSTHAPIAIDDSNTGSTPVNPPDGNPPSVGDIDGAQDELEDDAESTIADFARERAGKYNTNLAIATVRTAKTAAGLSLLFLAWLLGFWAGGGFSEPPPTTSTTNHHNLQDQRTIYYQRNDFAFAPKPDGGAWKISDYEEAFAVLDAIPAFNAKDKVDRAG